MKRYTDYADQQTILRLRSEARTYPEIAQETGWSYETVRKVCRAGQPHSVRVLGRPAKGRLSSFDPRVRLACLRIKVRHRRWGAELGARSQNTVCEPDRSLLQPIQGTTGEGRSSSPIASFQSSYGDPSTSA